MNIILSLNPTYANKIYAGEKIIEFRKTIPKTLLKVNDFYRPQETKIFIYETGKAGGVSGYCIFRTLIFNKLKFDEFGKIIKPDSAAFDYETYKDRILERGGGITESELYKYSLPQRFVYMWAITGAVRFPCKQSISKFEIKRPPQSFCYTNFDLNLYGEICLYGITLRA